MRFKECFLAAALLLGLLTVGVPSAAATDNPTLADVFAGDTHTQTPASAAGGIRHYRLGLVSDAATTNGVHRAGWDAAPGTTFTLTYRTWTSGLTPPAVPDGDGTDTCVGEVLRGNSAVVHATLFTATTCPADASTHTVTLSSAGTYRIRIRIVQTNELTDNYNINTDTGGVHDKGALRIKLDVSAITHGGYPAGATHAYTVAGETVGVTITHTAVLTDMSGSNVAVKSIDGTNAVAKTNTVAFAGTSSATAFTVDDTYVAASASYGVEVDVTGTSSLTGIPWTSIGTLTAPVTSVSEFVARRATFITIDPRVTATHLLLVNDATFGTPPMSEDNGDARYNNQVGRIATRYTNARSEGLAGASFLFSQSIQDAMAVLPPSTITGQTVSTQGGEAGWGPLKLWNDGAPTGSWTKTVDITGPSTIDNNAHLVTSSKTYTLNAPAGGEPGTGDPLVVSVTPPVADRGDKVLVGIGESFLDGTARTGNAANTFVYVYNPAGVLVVNAATPTEVQYGTYRYEYTLNATAERGNWLVLVRTTDPDTLDPIGANNVFNVNETEVADLVEDGGILAMTALPGFSEEATTALLILGLLLGFALHRGWFFVAVAASLGILSQLVADFPYPFLWAILLLLIAWWLEAWIDWKNKRAQSKEETA